MKVLDNGEVSWTVSDFERLEELGTGRFATVYKSIEKRSGKYVAVKVIDRARLAKENMEAQVQREIGIQNDLAHKNILRLLGFFLDEANIYMVLEWASGGELYCKLKEQPGERFDERQTATYMSQLVQALHHCQKHGVIHRDIKPENLLIGHDGELRMSDFGWAVDGSEQSRRLTLCGTADYLAPEMVARTGHDVKADIWCLGILCYELLYGAPPFEETTIEETFERIKTARFRFPRTPEVSEAAKDLISQLLLKDHSQRISLEDVANHRWLRQHVGFCLEPNDDAALRNRNLQQAGSGRTLGRKGRMGR